MHASGFLTYLIYFTTNSGQKIAHSWLLPHFTKTLKRRSKLLAQLPRSDTVPGLNQAPAPAVPPSPPAPQPAGLEPLAELLRHRLPSYRCRRPGAARPGAARIPSERRRHGSRAPWRAGEGRRRPAPGSGPPGVHGPPFCRPGEGRSALQVAKDGFSQKQINKRNAMAKKHNVKIL